jgi:hypothetical protein
VTSDLIKPHFCIAYGLRSISAVVWPWALTLILFYHAYDRIHHRGAFTRGFAGLLDHSSGPLAPFLWFLVSFLTFAYGAAVLRRTISHEPLVTVDEHGIGWEEDFFQWRTVGWDEIQAIRFSKYQMKVYQDGPSEIIVKLPWHLVGRNDRERLFEVIRYYRPDDAAE